MKKIGILVEGQAEQQTLAIITQKITIPDLAILKPIYTSIEPKATPKQIAKAAEAKFEFLQNKGVNHILLLLDLEDKDVCPGKRAKELEQACHALGFQHVKVVIKNRQFENWLIADVDAIRQLNSFDLTKSFENQIQPNKADHVKGPVSLLSKIKKDKKSYHKTQDGKAIAQKIDPNKIGFHSRSFRRFLHLLGHPDYKNQSKRPKS